jgi:hypothetical protein
MTLLAIGSAGTHTSPVRRGVENVGTILRYASCHPVQSTGHIKFQGVSQAIANLSPASHRAGGVFLFKPYSAMIIYSVALALLLPSRGALVRFGRALGRPARPPCLKSEHRASAPASAATGREGGADGGSGGACRLLASTGQARERMSRHAAKDCRPANFASKAQ